MAERASHPVRLVIIGNGMVGHALIDQIRTANLTDSFQITVFGEEPRVAYDRVKLSSYFEHGDVEALALTTAKFYHEMRVDLHLGDPVVSIDRQERKVRSRSGALVHYDQLVLATGSRPFVPPIAGTQSQGCFVYRTIEDLLAIERYASGCQRAHVIGGGLLGLEAAKALLDKGLETHVVEFAPRLMPMQLDDRGAGALQARIEQLGVRVHTDMNATSVLVDPRRRVRGLGFADKSSQGTDMVVFSAGIRPRDELAKSAGLALGPRGGIVVDGCCRTSDPRIFAIGECALFEDRCYGLVAPGYEMARVVVDMLGGTAERRFSVPDMSTKLKLLGVDVGSFGDAFARAPGAREFIMEDQLNGTYGKLVVSGDGQRLIGGMLVGDASQYASLVQVMKNDLKLPMGLESLLVQREAGESGGGLRPEDLPASAQVCSCNNVSKEQVVCAIKDDGVTELGALKKCTGAGTGCGGCGTLVGQILKAELAASGVEVKDDICEHFAHTRQELCHIVRVEGIRDFGSLLKHHGRGRGCEVCKPAVASILASTWNGHPLERAHAPLQDTNDQFLANIQKDGTYSVVPRIPGGEITPDKLIAIGEVARDHGLYTKITGGQRIDLFGATVEQLPRIWASLIEAGFESGHAYGKALRTVKSCVGSTWCRFGQQDSLGAAIRLEERYRGIRAPHKLKSAVSGCTRECAEAQSKDFGVIATEKGYNLYVCGNGGMKPQHAQLIATDLDEEQLVKLVDRFLMFYIRTADRLQRTATWLNSLDGGLGYLKQVLIEDSLGICADLEAAMETLVGSYECEWKTTLADPAKLSRFSHFVNSTGGDDSVVFVPERGQKRPARPDERVYVLSRGGVS